MKTQESVRSGRRRILKRRSDCSRTPEKPFTTTLRVKGFPDEEHRGRGIYFLLKTAPYLSCSMSKWLICCTCCFLLWSLGCTQLGHSQAAFYIAFLFTSGAAALSKYILLHVMFSQKGTINHDNVPCPVYATIRAQKDSLLKPLNILSPITWCILYLGSWVRSCKHNPVLCNTPAYVYMCWASGHPLSRSTKHLWPMLL